MENDNNKILEEVTNSEYKYGFYTDIEMDTAPRGLNEDIIRFISKKKNEPDFMLEFRLKAYKKWLEMELPQWAHVSFPPIDFQEIIFYAAPKRKKELKVWMRLIRNCSKHLINLVFPSMSKNCFPVSPLTQLSIPFL